MRPDFPHQARTIAAYGRMVAAGARRVLIQDPTGAGKTHIGLRAVSNANARGLQALWIAHRDELVGQPLRRALADGWKTEDVCVYRDGRPSGRVDAPLTIASIQTLVSRGITPPAGLVVFDEARHYVAAQWHSRVASHYRSAYLLGLDATPVRADGSPLGDLFDHLLIGSTVAELVAAGRLSPSVVLAPAEHQDELAADPVDAYLRHVPGQRAIIFCGAVAHARDVAARLRDAGTSAEHVDAKTDPEVRAGALRRFMSGETRVLCNVRILTEGTDLPPCEAIIHGTSAGSLADWDQKNGRGLRMSPETGKTRCTIVDLHGDVHRWGFPDDPRVFSLDGQGVRLKEGLPPLGQCPQCFAWVRSLATCAQCGRVAPAFEPRPPPVRAADLAEVRKGDAEDKRRERLGRWALEEVRAGREGYRIVHRYAGTYGGEKPERAWVHAAIDAARRTVDGEQARRQAADEPLMALLQRGVAASGES